MEVTTTTETNLITYELPLSDATRIALRLENLFIQFHKTSGCTTPLSTKTAMNALIKILEVIDRADLKSKFSQTLTQFSNTLNQLTNSPKIDRAKLQKTVSRLEGAIQYLHSQPGRIGDTLRQNEFLAQIGSNIANPGGVCDYRLPAYQLWQNKSAAEKSKDLKSWMNDIEPLREVTQLLLSLMRESTPLENVIAENGFYSQALNPFIPCQLVRVALPTTSNLYPEFGAGKHRLTIRFLNPNDFGKSKPTQAANNLPFQLACCKI